METKKANITLTGIYITDADNLVTGFFSEIPEAVSQGESFEEAERKLFAVLPDALETKQEMIEEKLKTSNVTRRSYSYSLVAG